MSKPGYLSFEAGGYAWKPKINYRNHPELYQVGKGEQGVLICEPYKSELGQYWRFKTEAIARESSEIIYNRFINYIEADDFVGADMSRKYLQMGFTRARRYANYKGGKKYDKDHNYQQMERGTGNEEKAKAAAIFYDKWQQAEANEIYKLKKENWKKENG